MTSRTARVVPRTYARGVTLLLAVEPVLPAHRYAQHEITDALLAMMSPDRATERLMRRIHAGCGVEHRHLALPLERYGELSDFGRRNDAFIEQAVELGAAALRAALDRAGIGPQEVDVIISTTVTGLAVPSLEARIATRVGLRRDVVRLPLLGLGCMGGAAGAARLHDVLRGRPGDVGVLVSVELCSLTVQREDTAPANLVASGLFGDGGAAVVAVGADHPRAGAPRTQDEPLTARILDSAGYLYEGTEDVMGWEVGAGGLRVVLSADVPDLVRAKVGPDVAAFLAGHGLTVADIGWWVAHPGGPKVIDALMDTLGVPTEALELTTRSLRTAGNLSSAAVLQILRATLDRRPPPGSRGLMMAMGPGFSLELVLLEVP